MSFTTQLPAAQEYVYIIHATGTNLYKIGQTRNLKARLRGLQTSSPYPLRMIDKCFGSQDLEFYIHREFADYRKTGEWFEFSEAQVIGLLNKYRQCHFCGNHGTDERLVIQGDISAICSVCVDACNRIICESDSRQPHVYQVGDKGQYKVTASSKEQAVRRWIAEGADICSIEGNIITVEQLPDDEEFTLMVNGERVRKTYGEWAQDIILTVPTAPVAARPGTTAKPSEVME
jgi:hypothetical protein